jgi:hypothetical protein
LLTSVKWSLHRSAPKMEGFIKCHFKEDIEILALKSHKY